MKRRNMTKVSKEELCEALRQVLDRCVYFDADGSDARYANAKDYAEHLLSNKKEGV